MKFEGVVATLEEALQFCNIARRAGGGEVLEALLPGYPGALDKCLVAINLNFSCQVRTRSDDDRWAMMFPRFPDEDLDATYKQIGIIAEALELQAVDRDIILPLPIASLAMEYDSAADQDVDLTDRRLFDKYKPYLPRHLVRDIERQDAEERAGSRSKL